LANQAGAWVLEKPGNVRRAVRKRKAEGARSLSGFAQQAPEQRAAPVAQGKSKTD